MIIRPKALPGGLYVAELVVINTTDVRKKRTQVRGRCIHLHLTEERAAVCAARLTAVPRPDLEALMQPRAGRKKVL